MIFALFALALPAVHLAAAQEQGLPEDIDMEALMAQMGGGGMEGMDMESLMAGMNGGAGGGMGGGGTGMESMMGMSGGGEMDFDPSMMEQMGGATPHPEGVAADVEHIACQSCRAVVRRAHFRTRQLREGMKGGKRLPEDEINTMVEGLCSPFEEEGEWLRSYTIIAGGQGGAELELKRRPTKAANCGQECETAALACRAVLGEIDMDLVEALFGWKLGKKELADEACAEWAGDMRGRCGGRRRPVPAEALARYAKKAGGDDDDDDDDAEGPIKSEL